MPANKHLQWFEVTEFGGLWTAGAASMMPANRAQVMSGCHPQPGGGLRAFLKVVETIDQYGAVHAYLNLPGASNSFAWTVDTAALDITGDIDLRVLAQMPDWTPTVTMGLLGKFNGSTSGYTLRLATAGTLILTWGDGAGIKSATSSVATGVTDNQPKFVRATLDVDNGAGGHDVKFYLSDDGVNWTQLGATVTTAGVTSIAANAIDLVVGGRGDGVEPPTGRIYYAEVRSGIGGLIVASPTFPAPGVTTFTDPQNRLWTVTGTAAIVQDGVAPKPVGFGVTVKAFYATSEPLFWLVAAETQGVTAGNWQLFSRDTENNEPQWTRNLGEFAGKIFSDLSPRPSQPMFARFKETYNKDFLALSMRESGTPSGSGLFEVTHDFTTIRNTTAFNDKYGAVALVEHQARLVAGYQDKIKFSAPGTSSFTASGSGEITLNPEGWTTNPENAVHEGPLVAWMVSVPPGDLAVATRDGRIYNVQGDLADPTVRELGRWTTMASHEPAVTPNGIFFILPNQGLARLGLDGSVDVISSDISPAVWNPTTPKVGLGQIAGTERYLFAPNNHTGADHKNGALIFDQLTGAWFTSTHTDDYTITNPRLMAADNNPDDSGIWVVPNITLTGAATPVLFHFRTGGYTSASVSTEERASTWEWKSSPLREPTGRYLKVREVQIPAYAFNGVSTLAVTIGGTTVTKTLPAGRSVQTFLFRVQDSLLDVKIKAKSNNSTVEAPMVEALRVGWMPGPLR